LGYDLPTGKERAFIKKIQKIYQMEMEKAPLYQTLLVKGSFDDSYSTSQYDGYSS
jgi:hypothetical protein